MELEDLKMLAAASLLGGSVHKGLRSNPNTPPYIVEPSDMEIEAAVRVAGKIWEEVLSQR